MCSFLSTHIVTKSVAFSTKLTSCRHCHPPSYLRTYHRRLVCTQRNIHMNSLTTLPFQGSPNYPASPMSFTYDFYISILTSLRFSSSALICLHSAFGFHWKVCSFVMSVQSSCGTLEFRGLDVITTDFGSNGPATLKSISS